MNLDYNFVYFGIIFIELQSFKVELSKLKYFSFLVLFYTIIPSPRLALVVEL